MFFGKKPIDAGFVIGLAVITLCIVLGLSVPALNLAALCLCGWMILLDRSLDHIFDLVFYLIPLSPIFKLSLNGFALFNLITIMVLARMLLANGLTFTFAGASSILLVLYVLAGIRNADLPSCIRFICQLLIGSMIMANPPFRSSLSVKRKNTMMALGIVVSSVPALMRGFFPRLDRYLMEYETTIRLGPGNHYVRFMGVETNSNMYTVLLSISLAVLAIYFIKGRLSRLDAALLLILVILGCMTVSMSFILSALMIAGLTVYFVSRKNPRILMASIVTGAVSCVLLFGLFGDSDAVQTILFRFQESSGADLSSMTTGRSAIWRYYTGYFLQHPFVTLVGKGLNAKLPYRAPHNYYIETIYYLGILGGMLYIASLVQIYGPSRYIHRKCEVYQQLPLLMLLMRGMARCLICEEKMLCIFLIYALSAIDTSAPEETPRSRGDAGAPD